VSALSRPLRGASQFRKRSATQAGSESFRDEIAAASSAKNKSIPASKCLPAMTVEPFAQESTKQKKLKQLDSSPVLG
jgi:hypothetical protein